MAIKENFNAESTNLPTLFPFPMEDRSLISLPTTKNVNATSS